MAALLVVTFFMHDDVKSNLFLAMVGTELAFLKKIRLSSKKIPLSSLKQQQ